MTERHKGNISVTWISPRLIMLSFTTQTVSTKITLGNKDAEKLIEMLKHELAKSGPMN